MGREKEMRMVAFVAFVFALVAIVLFAGVAPAEAQYYDYHRDQVGGLVQGNLNLVRGLHGQLDRANYERGLHQLIFHDDYGYYGYYDNGGAFYAVADRQGRRLSRPVKVGIGVGVGAGVGAVFGYGVSSNAKGTAIGAGIGAGIGAVAGLIAGRDRGQQQYQPQSVAYTGGGHGQLVPTPTPEQNERQDPQPAPNMGAEPWPTQSESESATLPNMQAKNCTNMWGEVYDWDQSTGIWLAAGESVSLPTSTRGGYRMLASILSASGGQTIRSWADSRFVDSTGSILFVEPK